MIKHNEVVTVENVEVTEFECFVKHVDGGTGWEIAQRYLVKYVSDPLAEMDDLMRNVFKNSPWFAPRESSIMFQQVVNNTRWAPYDETIIISIECDQGANFPDLYGLFPSLDIIYSASWRDLYGFDAGGHEDEQDHVLYCRVEKREWDAFVRSMEAKEVFNHGKNSEIAKTATKTGI